MSHEESNDSRRHVTKDPALASSKAVHYLGIEIEIGGDKSDYEYKPTDKSEPE